MKYSHKNTTINHNKSLKKDTKFILLMTACINPMGMPSTALQDINLRKEQYQNALKYYLNSTKYKIVFVENTNTDISMSYQKYIQNGRLDILTFNGNKFNKKLGKGYGEGEIIKYAFSNSKILKQCTEGVIKVSGRHIVSNINLIANVANRLIKDFSNFTLCDINPKTQGANSDLFIASTNFYAKQLLPKLELIDESQNHWFEHILYKSIIDFKGQFIYLPIPLNQHGMSGSMGTEFEKPLIKIYILNAFKALLYYYHIKNIK